jgi:uncharacterized protein DUF2505
MPRTFDLHVESPVTVEQVVSAFGNDDYWQERLATFGGGTAALDGLTVDESGTVSVTITISLLRDWLPSMLTRLHRGDLEMVRNEQWTWIDGGRVRGDVTVAVRGAPLTVVGEALISPAQSGSLVTYTTTVTAKVPVVGGKIEGYIGGQAADEISAIQQFTTEWIGRHG